MHICVCVCVCVRITLLYSRNKQHCKSIFFNKINFKKIEENK